MEMKTFKEIINEGYEYPSVVDETTQGIITSFFCYREIASNKKFVTWFNRELLLNYPYYLQLLRVDPSVSDYDWFVENYMERELKHTGSNDSTSTATITGDDKNIRTFNNKITNNRTPNLTNTSTTTYGAKHHETFDDTTSTDTTDNNQGFSRAGALSRVSPMSASYTADEMKANDKEKITVGKQSLSGYSKGFPDMNIKNPTQSSDALTTEGRLSAGSNKTNRKTNSADGNVQWGEGSDTVTNTTTGLDENITFSESVTPETVTITKNDSNTTTATGSNNANDRERYSGRNHLPADVITGATTCIQQSVSFNWLRRQLDKCFMQVYDYDEDEEEV